jgi:hypothetical protein
MQLSEWMKQKKKKAGWIANKIGKSATAVRRYAKGERRPDDEAMIEIYKLTGGMVDPNSFYDLPPLNDSYNGHPGQLSLLDAVAGDERACA